MLARVVGVGERMMRTTPTPRRLFGLDALLDDEAALDEAEAPLQALLRWRQVSPFLEDALGAILEARWAIFQIRCAVEREHGL